ncbi:hypothetical protein JCM8097_001816 [Rhodosporidiobolus ruineniae]
MADVSPMEAQRIVAHMNADHASSLTHYLQAFAGVPLKLARQDPKITVFVAERMEVEYGSVMRRRTWEVRWEPRMGPGEARGRLVKMHHEAREKLGLSDYTLSTFRLGPSAILSTVLLLALQAWLIYLPPSTAGRLFHWHAPLFVPLLRFLGYAGTRENLGMAVKGWWIAVMWAAHTYEIPTQLWPVLRRYNVEKTSLKLVYAVLTFISGFPIWTSLRRICQEEEAKLAADKGGKAH